MTGFKKISAITLLSAIFVILNIYFFNRALDFSKIYPFKRALIGNTLSSKIDTSESDLKFKSKIIQIEDEKADSRNIRDLLKKYSTKFKLNITLNSDGIVFDKIVLNTNNYDYLLFIIFLMLFGNIHYIWGTVVYFNRPNELRLKLFFFYSVALGFFYFCLVELYTFANYTIIFVLIVLLLGYLSVLLGFNLTNRNMNKILATIILVFAGAIIIYSGIIIFQHRSIDDVIYSALLIYFIFCSFFTFYRLAFGIITGKYSFVKWRNFILLISLFIGNSIPLLNILFSVFTEASFPICFSSSLTIFFPLLAGNAFLKYNQYDFSGFKVFQLNDLKILLYNVLITVFTAAMLYSLFTLTGFTYHKILYQFTAVLVIIILLNSHYYFLKNIKNIDYENKDNYAFSSQKIAEISTSSESIEYKLDQIYKEISELTKTKTLKLILFMDSANDYYLNLKEYIEVLAKSTDIFSVMNINKGVIVKYALIRNSAIEERVYDFLEKRDCIFAIPVIEGDDINGALLISERNSRGFYSDADIQYFQTVVYQILQLIESDRLYKDYILKKQYEKEIDNASYVQLRLFPKAALDRDSGIDISFFYRPFLRVIGDYFDFFKIDEDRTAIIIGDVSGHGLSTAMVLSAVNSITHAILREEKTFEKTFIEINNYLNKSYRGIELITLFIGIFNRKTKIMDFINAGHQAPILIRKNENQIRQIEGRSKILGADPDAEYSASSINLLKDDEIILYTDGVMEIYNEKTDSGINEEKFIKIISDNLEKDIDGKIIEIEKKIKYFSEDIKDDITIIGVKVL